MKENNLDKYEYRDNSDSTLEFNSGEISCSTYSYEISSYGSLVLDEKEARKLYEVMKNYFES